MEKVSADADVAQLLGLARRIPPHKEELQIQHLICPGRIALSQFLYKNKNISSAPHRIFCPNFSPDVTKVLVLLVFFL